MLQALSQRSKREISCSLERWVAGIVQTNVVGTEIASASIVFVGKAGAIRESTVQTVSHYDVCNAYYIYLKIKW